MLPPPPNSTPTGRPKMAVSCSVWAETSLSHPSSVPSSAQCPARPLRRSLCFFHDSGVGATKSPVNTAWWRPFAPLCVMKNVCPDYQTGSNVGSFLSILQDRIEQAASLAARLQYVVQLVTYPTVVLVTFLIWWVLHCRGRRGGPCVETRFGTSCHRSSETRQEPGP